jgi:hypothetical protein
LVVRSWWLAAAITRPLTTSHQEPTNHQLLAEDYSDLSTRVTSAVRVETIVVAPRAERAGRDVSNARRERVVGDDGPEIDA